MTTANDERLLRVAFLAGAVTDAFALAPMLVPPLGRLLWGFEDHSGAYRFAMGYGASLMLGWTALSLASRRPLERSSWPLRPRDLNRSPPIVAVVSGDMPAVRMIPTWMLQAVLLGLLRPPTTVPRGGRVAA
jgi:hypothetical protein